MSRLDNPDPFDICRCGDYRHQHDAHGCRLNGLGHGGAPPCRRFERSETAAAYFERHGIPHPKDQPHG